MRTSTFSGFPRLLAGLLVGLCLVSVRSFAQTPLTWTNAADLGAGSGNYLSKAAFDGAGNTYQIGVFSATTSVGGTWVMPAGANDGFIAKYDAVGVLQWVRQIGGIQNDIISGVAVDATGNVYVTGYYSGTSALNLGNNVVLSNTASGSKAYIVCYSPQGTPQWALAGSGSFTSWAGGLGFDAAGNLYVTGRFSGNFTLGGLSVSSSKNGSVFLARLAPATGTVQWLVPAIGYNSNGIGGFSAPELAVAASGETFVLDNSGYDLVVDNTTTLYNRGNDDIFIAKFSAQGVLQWAQQAGGTSNDAVYQGVVDAAGNLYVATYFAGPAQYGTTMLPGFGNNDACLAKYSPQGSLLWAEPGGGSGYDYWRSVALDVNGQPYVAGSTNPPVQYGPFPVSGLAGSARLVVASYSKQGQIQWLRSTSAGGASGHCLGLDATGNVRVLGQTYDYCTFGTYSLSNSRTTFLATLANPVLAAASVQPPTPLALYPNPATDQLHMPALIPGTRVQLLDALGRVARETTVSVAAQVSVRGLAPGLYTVRATEANGHQRTGRVLVAE